MATPKPSWISSFINLRWMPLQVVIVAAFIFSPHLSYKLSSVTLRLPPCDREQLRDGAWIEDADNKPYHSPMVSGSPNCDSRANGTGFDPYQWQPEESGISCEFKPGFDKDAFCHLMQNVVLLFLGDSITFEQYASLVTLLGGRAKIRLKIRAALNKKEDLSIVQNVCGGGNTTLVFHFYKHISGGVGTYMRETFPTMILMNGGAHYRGDEAHLSGVEAAFKSVRQWQQLCAERNLTCPFFWRTATPGHANCGNFSKPENNIAEMETYVASNPKYSWEQFKGQNELVLQKLDEISHAEGLAYEVIDGYEIGIRRPDDHLGPNDDCLHSCNPGAADAYNRILLHYLRVHRTPEDIAKTVQYTYPWNRKSNIQLDGSDFNWDDRKPYIPGFTNINLNGY